MVKFSCLKTSSQVEKILKYHFLVIPYNIYWQLNVSFVEKYTESDKRSNYLNFKASSLFYKCINYYPPPKAEGYIFGVVRPAARPSGPHIYLLGLYLKDYYRFEHETLELLPIVILHTVRASQTCWGYICNTFTDLNMTLQGYIDFSEEKCTAQEP